MKRQLLCVVCEVSVNVCSSWSINVGIQDVGCTLGRYTMTATISTGEMFPRQEKKKKTNLNPDLVETYQVSPVRRMIPSGFRQRLTLMKRLQESVSRRQAHQDNTTPAPSILTHLAPGFKKKCNSAYFLISHRMVRSDSANAHA